MYINQKIDTFLGLNNMLNPSSPTYLEGMAYRSNKARIDEHGLWAAQPFLDSISDAPDIQACPHATTGHFKPLAVDGTLKMVTYGLTTSCDVGANKKLYSTNGSGKVKNATGDLADLERPAIESTSATAGAVETRAQNGTYYYVATLYDDTYEMEGRPSSTAKSLEIDHDSATQKPQITVSSSASSGKLRLYRSRRTSPSDGVYSPTNIWYFITEKDATGGNVTFDDIFTDEEIANAEYEGRGTIPPDDIDFLASLNNRMLYFKDNILYWSSAGRPQEVAQEYSVTIVSGTAIDCKPKLSTGVYGEAKFEITELAGHTVKAALPFQGKLYVWTASKMGYIEPTNRLEGYRFRLLRDGVGVTSDKVLALSPYGIFGADRQGIWLLTIGGQVKRLSYGIVDLQSGTDTSFTDDDFTNSFGAWCPQQQEYIWGVSGKIIAYQAVRNIFVGPYDWSVSGGHCLITDTGAHCYLTGAVTPSPDTADSVTINLEFWLGQSTPTTVKERLKIEMVHSQAPSANVTARVYQNSITSTSGADDSGDITYSGSIGIAPPVGAGRYILLQLTIPQDSPLAVIQYRYNAVGWTDDHGR